MQAVLCPLSIHPHPSQLHAAKTTARCLLVDFQKQARQINNRQPVPVITPSLDDSF